MEVSVHLDLSEDLPTDRYFVEIEIPDDITIFEIKIEDPNQPDAEKITVVSATPFKFNNRLQLPDKNEE